MQTMKILRNPYSQRGNGLGSIFSSLARVFIPVAKTVFKASKPIVKNAVKAVGKEALQVGVDTLSDVISGDDVKTSLKRNVKAGSKRTLEKVGGVVKNKQVKLDSKAIKAGSKTGKSHSSAKVSKSKKKKIIKTIFD